MQAKVDKHFSFTFCTSLLYHTWYEAHRDIFTPQTLLEYSFSFKMGLHSYVRLA